MSSQRYRAADAILNGVTGRPDDIHASAWFDMIRLARKGTLFLARHAQMIAASQADADQYDAFAHGVLIESGASPRKRSLWRSFCQYGALCPCTQAASPEESADAPPDQPSALRWVRRLIDKAQESGTLTLAEMVALASDPDGQAFGKAVAGSMSGLSELMGLFAVPHFYFSVRKDADQNQPLEISYGATIRQKTAKAAKPDGWQHLPGGLSGMTQEDVARQFVNRPQETP